MNGDEAANGARLARYSEMFAPLTFQKVIASVLLLISIMVAANRASASPILCEKLFSHDSALTILSNRQKHSAGRLPHSEGRLPHWSRLDPKEQYRRYGVLFADWAPKLSEQQIEEIHGEINKISGENPGQVDGSSIERLPFTSETLRALRVYISGLEKFMGQRADYFILRSEKGRQVYGHQHGVVSKATASISLIGRGTYVRTDDAVFEAPTMETVLFRDGTDSIYHGAPQFSGRRILFGVSFYN